MAGWAATIDYRRTRPKSIAAAHSLPLCLATLRVAKNIKQTAKKITKKDYSTRYSQVVTHPSTNRANTSLTSEIGRDPVFSHVYGHSRECCCALLYKPKASS